MPESRKRYFVLFCLNIVTAVSGHAAELCKPLLLALEPAGDEWTLDGAALRPLPESSGHGPGTHNQGLYTGRYAGEPVLFKRVDRGALVEMIRSGPGHLIGGPRMIGLARGQRDDQPVEMIVMEHLFAGERTVTRQGLFLGSEAGRTQAALRMIAGSLRTRITRQLADLLAQGWTHDILPPFDFDFIMTASRIRLIDVGSLIVGRRAKQNDWDRFFIHALLRRTGRTLELTLGRELAAYFRTDLLAALRPLVNDEERFARMQMIVDEIYDHEGNYIPLRGLKR